MEKKERFLTPSGILLEIGGKQRKYENRVHVPDNAVCENLPVAVKSCGFSIWGENVSMLRRDPVSFVVELVTAGELRYIQNSNEYRISRGDCFLQHRGGFQLCATGAKGQFVHKRYISFRGIQPDEITYRLKIADTDKVHLPDHDFHRFIELNKKIRRELVDKNTGFQYRISAMGYEILTIVASHIAPHSTPPALTACINFIHQAINRDIDINALAEIANTSRTGLFRLFKTGHHNTPAGMLKKIRMQQAAVMLQYSQKPVKEIAALVGYREPRSFRKAFTEFTGMSPAIYCKNKRLIDS